MESYKCPLTHKIFEDPVLADDGHTYERKAIIDWITQNGISPITQQPMSVNTLKTNHTVKKMIEEFTSMSQFQYQFQLNVEIKKSERKPLFQGFGKSIYKVEWINRHGPPIVLVKIDGAKANQEASFYVHLSCHPHIIRTYGFVQNNRSSVMLVQEYASQGDLSELLREDEFKPCERVLWKIFEQICDAMICLADNDIVHGDLACRNVLVFQMDPNEVKKNLVKLTDFGLTQQSKLYSVINTPSVTRMTIIPVRYAAPEILRDAVRFNYSEKSDSYSMGVFMWEACSYGHLPYSDLDDDDDVRERKLNDQRLPRPSLCSDELWHIINECWNQDPQHRPDFKTLKQSILTLQFQNLSKSQIQSREEPIKSSAIRSPVTIRKYTSHTNLNHISHSIIPISESEIKQNIHRPKLAHLDQMKINDHARDTMFVCDCEDKFTNQIDLDEHKKSNCRILSITCPFCHEHLPSSDALRNHLVKCGNKTEQCPKCDQFIRRAIFFNHSDNNCANLNETDLSCEQYYDSLPGASLQSFPLYDSSSVDLTNNEASENRSSLNELKTDRKRIPAIVECEYCHTLVSQNHYIEHKDSCLRDRRTLPPSVRTQPSETKSSLNNESDSEGKARVNCNLCNESISLLQFLSHKKACSQRKKSETKV